MACNCATDEYIKRLYKELGVKRNEKVKLTFTQKVAYYLRKAAMAITLTLIAPILFIYICCVAIFGDGKISFTKFFGLKPINIEEYVRKQQELQNKN